MAFRRSAQNDPPPYYPPTLPAHDQQPPSAPSPTMRKRQRPMDMHAGPAPSAEPHPSSSGGPPPVGDDAFIADHDAVDSAGDDDDDDEKPKSDKKAGRRKIKIEFIQDKSRRHITFSKRKAGMSRHTIHLAFSQCLFSGIMKKVTFLPIIFLPRNRPASAPGIRTLDPHRHTGPPPCRV